MLKHEEKMEAAFSAAYSALNPVQRQAVDTIDGPVMVIAGPGTGKTQILTLRIANILRQTDTAPESILALTFTESATRAMRDRLRHYLGSAAYRVPIYTFHGFAGELIRRYPDAFPRIIGGQPATDLERIKLIEEILTDSAFIKLRPAGNPSYYVTIILRTLAELKQESVLPDDLAGIIARQETTLEETPQFHEKGAHKGKVRGEYHKLAETIAKNRELLGVYRRYEVRLREMNRFDFADMLLGAVAALKSDEAMLRDLQETYQYLLADEHQDVNGSQNGLLELLANYHDHPNIFTVGDEKQAIYRFQGASLENFLFFDERFPGTVTIALTDNYRSGQPILDAAHSLIAAPDGPLKELRVPLESQTKTDATVELRRFSHQAVEDDWLIKAVQSELDTGTEPNEIAVIVRTNREVEALSAQLRQAGITVQPSAEGDILHHPILTAVEALLCAAAEPENETAIFALLHASYWGISGGDCARVLSARSRERPLSNLIVDEGALASLKIENPSSVLKISALLEAARERLTHEAPHHVVAFLLRESGLLDQLTRETALESARVVRRLYDEIERLVTAGTVNSLSDILTELTLRRSYNLPLEAPFVPTGQAAVAVMTAHKSKGLEFAVVFVPHLTDQLWGGGTNRTGFDLPLTKLTLDTAAAALDDERRLLYVAMTRAKTRLRLSAATENSAGRDTVESRLLSNIDPRYLPEAETETAAATFSPVSVLMGEATTRLDQETLISLFASRGFSATSLNNYLDSPWQYIYRNLLRVPEIQSLPFLYGTAIHNVLQGVTREHTKNQAWCPEGELPARLRRELDRLPLSIADATRLHEKGLDALVAYLAHLKTTCPPQTREEFAFTVMLPTGISALPEIPLTGKLDRLDFDGAGWVVRVVDYKTGKPKSRNDIEGKTKTSRGHYKRQLTFYALLLSLYDDERYRCREGVLSFVEPDRHGVIKEEVFTITDAEIESLKAEIIAAVEVMLSGEFGTCDKEICDYCHLAEQWQQRV